MNTPPRLQRTQSVNLHRVVGRRLSFSERRTPPDAPDDSEEFSQEDYVITEFEDLNDGDVIYVRWSVPHQRAYMYSNLDRPTQWVHDDWTLRKTIEVGLGYNHSGDNEFNFDNITSNFAVCHREILDDNGEGTIEVLNLDNPIDAVRVDEILDRPMSCPAANKIMYVFSVR